MEPKLNGRLAAELVAKFVPQNSKVAIVTGMMATEDNGKKVEGFSEVFHAECRNGSIVQVIEGHEDEEETYDKCVQLLRKQRDLSGIYISTVNCIPVCKAIRESGRRRSSESLQPISLLKLFLISWITRFPPLYTKIHTVRGKRRYVWSSITCYMPKLFLRPCI